MRFLPDGIGHVGCAAALALMMAGFAAPLAQAQGLSALRNSAKHLTRPVIRSIRTVIPTLRIERDRKAGSATKLYLNDDRNLLFIVLDDGSARLWDLERGVQLGGAIGGGIVSGAFRDGDAGSEAIAIRRDGSVVSIDLDGTHRRIRESAAQIDPDATPVASGNGKAIAFRTIDRGWYLTHEDFTRGERLPDTARKSRPILSRDGSKVVYRTADGVLVVRTVFGDGTEGATLGECAGSRARITAGAFTPDGRRVVLGDERGNLCAWLLSDTKGPGKVFDRRGAYPGAIRSLSVGQGSALVALGGDNTRVAIWRILSSVRRVASLELKATAVHSILLDDGRGWVLSGERDGTVGIHSLEEEKRIARLISTNEGWVVLDSKGRFDGSQNGFDALVWAGKTQAQTLPIDAFSESYFEPGLLSRLDAVSPVFLNEDIRNLSEVGYFQPPDVTIDPVERRDMDSHGQLSVRIRIDKEYPSEDVSEVRLYHNGKLVPPELMVPDTGEALVEYLIRPIAGRNTLRAIGVGPDGVEGRPASAAVTVTAPKPGRPSMQVVAIGINEYGTPNLELRYSRNDAQAIVSTLRKRAGSLFGDVSATTLLDFSAHVSAIEEHISLEAASPQDVLVVYFAGHGYAFKEEGRWEWYLLPFTRAWGSTGIRSWKEKKKRTAMIRQHGVSSRQLMSFLTKTEPRRVFLILDSCQSGAVVEVISDDETAKLGDSVGQKILRRVARVGGIHVLAASRKDEDALELESTKHGALTYLVLEGIRGAADRNGDKAISVREIVEYATRKMPLLSRRLVQEDISQKPVGYSRGADFSLVGL